MSIEVQSLTKSYATQKAVNAIGFKAKKGEIIGFLGPNGAGKSTTMKILTGYLKPDEGTVIVNGINVLTNPKEVQQELGYLPEQNPLYTEMYVKEYLKFRAQVYKIDKSRIDEVIEQVGLTSESHKKIGTLSKGFQQRVGLAAAIIHQPKVLILDEPTTGLDPNQLVAIRKLIKELGKDTTILFSTHIMQEVEAVCDRVIIINKGKLLLDKPLKELKTNNEQHIQVAFDYKIEIEFVKKLPNLVMCKNTFDTTWSLVFNSKEDMRPIIFDFAQENGLKILELSAKNPSLESLFTEITNPS